jgi:hypothetical protein
MVTGPLALKPSSYADNRNQPKAKKQHGGWLRDGFGIVFNN